MVAHPKYGGKFYPQNAGSNNLSPRWLFLRAGSVSLFLRAGSFSALALSPRWLSLSRFSIFKTHSMCNVHTLSGTQTGANSSRDVVRIPENELGFLKVPEVQSAQSQSLQVVSTVGVAVRIDRCTLDATWKRRGPRAAEVLVFILVCFAKFQFFFFCFYGLSPFEKNWTSL